MLHDTCVHCELIHAVIYPGYYHGIQNKGLHQTFRLKLSTKIGLNSTTHQPPPHNNFLKGSRPIRRLRIYILANFRHTRANL